jgi:ABC-type lipoprotein export system ATPase subunit
LEAIYILDFYTYNGFDSIDPFLLIAKNRNITRNRIKKHLKDIHIIAQTNCIELNIDYKSFYKLSKEEKEEVKKKFNQDYKEFITFNMDDGDCLDIEPIDNISLEIKVDDDYINSSKPTNKRLVEQYSKIQSIGIQHKFLTYLKLLDNNLEWIEPQLLDDEMLLRINLKNPERSLVSSELGEGTNRYIEILATLLSNSNGTVFIDEVENGIHYTKLYDVWKAIIEIVQKEEIQLFVTTHDRESIEALAEASKDMNFNKISSVKLEKDENNVTFPIILNHDSFFATVDSGMDIR